MVFKTPTAIKARFEGGDLPTEQDFTDLIDGSYAGVVNVRSYENLVTDGDWSAAAQAAIDFAAANSVGTVDFRTDGESIEYLFGTTVRLKSNVRIRGDLGQFNSFFRGIGGITIFDVDPSAFVSQVQLERLFLYQNVSNANPLLKLNTASQLTMNNCYVFECGKVFDFTSLTSGVRGSDVAVKDTVFEHCDELGDFDGFTFATFSECSFIQASDGTSQQEIDLPAPLFESGNIRGIGFRFNSCWFERVNIFCDAALSSFVDGHFQRTQLTLGPHSVGCRVAGSAEHQGRTFVDLGWNNQVEVATGNNLSQDISYIPRAKNPDSVLDSSQAVTVTPADELLFIASIASERSDQAIDPSTIRYWDDTNSALIDESVASNTYAAQALGNEVFSGVRQFSRFTDIVLVKAPPLCTSIRSFGYDGAAETDAPVSALIYNNLLLNGQLKNADNSATSLTSWTNANVVATLEADDWVNLSGTGSWRIAQTVSSLTPGADYAFFVEWRDSVSDTRVKISDPGYAETNSLGWRAQLTSNAQEKYTTRTSGQISAGYFKAIRSSILISVSNFQTSSIDIRWLALIKI